jgi:5-methylthioadenosine/S-adenosylhomocysteine deaminase
VVPGDRTTGGHGVPGERALPGGPPDLLITHVSVVRGGAGGEQFRIEDDRAIAITGSRIAWIGPDSAASSITAARTIDGRGRLAVPGLINTHNHLFQNLVKGLGDEMYLLPWVEALILPTSEVMTPEETYIGALLGCIESLHSGSTAVIDFMFGLPDIEQHRAVMRAMRDAGIRGFFGRATRDINPDSGYRDPWYLPLDEVLEQIGQLGREFPSGLRVPSALPAPGTVRTMTTDGLIQVHEWAVAANSRITIHMGEYVEEREHALARWGSGAFAKAEEIGFLDDRVVAAHCIKLDEDELAIAARTGMHVAWCPVSNYYLGNGVAPVLTMLDLGISVGLAADGGAVGNTQDMLEAMKFGALVMKGTSLDPRVFGARDALRLATSGGARSLGLEDELGALEPGRLADLFLFDPWRLKTVPVHEPLSALVWASSQANVDTVVVDGQLVVEDGRSTRIDEADLMREVTDRAATLARRAGTAHLALGRRWTPFGPDRRPVRRGVARETAVEPGG